MLNGLLWALASAAYVALVLGCGGGSRSEMGSVALQVAWPPRESGRLIPAASESITFEILRGSPPQLERSARVTRPNNQVTLGPLAAGEVMLRARAYPNADGTGVAQAEASKQITIVGGQTTTERITLGTTIVRVEITPSPIPEIQPGTDVQLTATAKDADDNIVLVAGGNWSWQSSDEAVATVDAGGKVHGVGAGTAQVTARESESAIADSASVRVENLTGLADSPWPKDRGDAQNTGHGTGSGATANLQWVYPGDGSGMGTPVVGVDGTVYVKSGYNLHAVRPDGQLRWSSRHGGNLDWSPAAALAADGTVYVGRGANVYALTQAGGQKWVSPNLSLYGYVTRLSIARDGTVYAGTYAGYWGGSLEALSPAGALLGYLSLGEGVEATPAIGRDDTVYTSCLAGYGDDLYAHNSDRSLRWSVAAGAVRYACPAIGADGTVYASVKSGSTGAGVLAVQPTDGATKWLYPVLPAPATSPAIASDGTVYVASTDGALHAIWPDGSRRWVLATPGRFSPEGSPAIGGDGVVYIPSNDGVLYAVGPNGASKWTIQCGTRGLSAPAIGADGTVYVGSWDGSLYAIR